MAKSKASGKNSSDSEKWKKIFNSLVLMLKNQQTQILSLAKDRKILEDRIKLQHYRWISDVNLFQDQISQMKRDFIIQEMERMVEGTKTEMLMGLKEREAIVYKKKCESADSDLADFRDCFDYLSRQCSAEKDVTTSADDDAMQSELMRLKGENEKLRVDKDHEVSALLSEKKFVWNQYNEMERDLNEQLRVRRNEVTRANDKIQTLLSRMEELQSSDTAKDATIASLRTNMTKLESEAGKKDEQISQLSMEVELLKKSRNDSGTPLLRQCTNASGSSRLNGKTGLRVRSTVTTKKESDTSHGREKASSRSKRKAEYTPKLFTSTFKVPNLKSPSPAPK